jgi:two-component system NtrC family sensor kinase
MAGMAEVATTVLHNVGNVLNSVNVSASLVADKVKSSKAANVVQGRRHAAGARGRPGRLFGQRCQRGQVPRVPGHAGGEPGGGASTRCWRNWPLCAPISITSRKSSPCSRLTPRVAGLQENLNPADLVEDALRLNAGAVERHHVQVIREYSPTPTVSGGQTQSAANPGQSHPQRQVRLGRPRSRATNG